MLKNNNFVKLLKPFNKKWVALLSDGKRVVGSGKTPQIALRQSIKNGVEKPLLTLAANNYAYIVS